MTDEWICSECGAVNLGSGHNCDFCIPPMSAEEPDWAPGPVIPHPIKHAPLTWTERVYWMIFLGGMLALALWFRYALASDIFSQ